MREAVVEAATLRLRPILMTTVAMVLGALPLALATGAGAESRQQIGWVIVGGMSLGTLLTIFVVPPSTRCWRDSACLGRLWKWLCRRVLLPLLLGRVPSASAAG